MGGRPEASRASRAYTRWRMPRGERATVVYYRIYSPTDAMWHAWNAAQDFDVEEFEEAVPDLVPRPCNQRARQSDGPSQRGRQPRQARVGQAGHPCYRVYCELVLRTTRAELRVVAFRWRLHGYLRRSKCKTTCRIRIWQACKPSQTVSTSRASRGRPRTSTRTRS